MKILGGLCLKESSNKESKLNKFQQKARKALYINTNIQIIDNDKAIIENCKHIVECNDIMVKLLTNNMYVQIWGQSLTISDYNTENVIVKGKISSIELIPKGKAD